MDSSPSANQPHPSGNILAGQRGSERLPWRVWLIILASLIFGGQFLFQTPIGQRGLLAFVILGFIGMLLIFSPRAGVPVLLVFLAVVGGMRRWLIPLLGWTATDPLVLVGPILAGIYFLNLLATRLLPRDTRLARLLLWLVGLMVLEIVNPLQGGVAVGIAGALFYIVPILWYYIGRKLVSLFLLERLFLIVVGIACLAALYGLYQTWFGFLPSEIAWMKLSGMGALSVNGTTRALSFFTSPQEYSSFIGIAIAVLWTLSLRGNWAALIPIPLLALALFLESSRGAVIGTLAICTALWAIQGRRIKAWIPRGVLALVLAVVGLVLSLQQAQNGSYSAQTQNLINHQTQGLLDPTNAKTSTAGTHSAMVGIGIVRGFTNPIGLGLGATTIAASKFGDGAVSTEIDFSNMFTSLGFIGGLLYVYIIGTTIFKALRYWHLTRSYAALGLVAILFGTVGQWLNGQQYAASFLIWLCIGVLDRMQPDSIASARKQKFDPHTPFPAGAK